MTEKSENPIKIEEAIEEDIVTDRKMASSTSITEKDMAAINELRAEWGLNDVGALEGKPDQVTTNILMMNHGVGNAVLKDINNWSGHVIDNFPPTIPLNRSAKTTHRGVPPDDSQGSKGAAIFYGPNQRGGPEDVCAWVFAWSSPGDGSPNKVYVNAAPSTVYPTGNVNWDAILAELDNSNTTNESRSPVDKITGAEAVGRIDLKGNTPVLVVTFNITKQ